MSARLGRALLLTPGVAAFLLILVLPALVLAYRSVELGRSDGVSALIEARQWGLFGRSVYLAAGGAGCAVLLSLPAAYVIGRIGRLTRAPAIGALLLAPLLLPPMVYAFGWQRMGLPSLPGALCCVWGWASWGWPVPAMLIGAGWAGGGRSAYEAAILVTTPGRAFVRAVLPLLVRQTGLALLILFAQFWELVVLVSPAIGHGGQHAHAHVPWVEAAVTAGFLGLFFLVFAASLRRNEAVPLKDPRLRECLEYHQ